MKKLLFGLMVVLMGVLLVASVSFAYIINDSIGRYPVGGTTEWIGGTFLNSTTGELTFCLELNESLNFGQSYSGTITTLGAIGGGLSGGDPDPLSASTQWLYDQFLASHGDTAHQIAYQLAIWVEEGEVVQSTWAAYGGYMSSNPSYNFNYLGSTILGYAATDISNAAGKTGDPLVEVLNLYDSTGNKQSVITRVPEPGTLIFLGTGLLGLAFAIRRRNS